MGNEVQVRSASADPTKLTTPLIASALADSPYFTPGQPAWKPEYARRVFEREGMDWFQLRDETRASLAPARIEWLEDRLRLLWKSSTPSGSLDALAWLHETVRLLSDLPRSVLAWAIDEAVRTSERGFMPSVGEIRKLAESMHAKLRKKLARLELMCAPPQDLQKQAPKGDDDFVRCTAEQAREIRKRYGLIDPDEAPERRADYVPVEQRSAPTRADYIAWGVNPADIPAGSTDHA